MEIVSIQTRKLATAYIIGMRLGSSVSGGTIESQPLPQPKEAGAISGTYDYTSADASAGLSFSYVDELGQPTMIKFSEALCGVNRTKVVARTPMPGRDHDLLQLISNGSYEIDVGLAISYPIGDDRDDGSVLYQDFEKVINMLNHKGPLQAQSAFLDAYGISQVVVLSHSATEDAWVNRQPITIKLISDEPYVIKELRDA